MQQSTTESKEKQKQAPLKESGAGSQKPAKPTPPSTTRPPTPSAQKPRPPGAQFPEYVRVRFPKPHKREVLGIIQENYGNKLLVKCLDGHTRVCRIPGKIRYKVRVKIGDLVLVQKWTVQENEKGDYLYRYTKTQVNYLIRKGVLRREDLEQ